MDQIVNETKRAIQRAFIHLYNEAPTERINVRAVCLDAPVARTTFYAYYGNLGDLKKDIENTLLHDLRCIAASGAGNELTAATLRTYMLAVLDFIQSNWNANHAFLVAHPNARYIEGWKAQIQIHLAQRLGDRTHDPRFCVAAEGISSAMLGIYTRWLQNPRAMNVNDIAEISAYALYTLSHGTAASTPILHAPEG